MAQQNESASFLITTIKMNDTSHYSNLTNPFECSYPVDYPRFIGLMILLVISLTGNLLVILVFYRNKTLRNSVHYFIVNMAASDVFLQFTYLLPILSGILHKDNRWLLDGILGSALCKFTFFSWQVSRLVSLFSMMVTAFDRFRGILYPLKQALISRKRIPKAIAGIWITSLALSAHNLYGVRLVSSEAKNYCVFQWDPPSYTRKALTVSYLMFLCVIAASAVILTVLYSKIIVHLYKQNTNFHLQSEVLKARAKMNRQITIMLVVVVVTFFAIWSQFTVTVVIWIFNDEERLQCDGQSLLIYLIYPIFNPVIYCIFNENYRQGFKELLCSCCHSNTRFLTAVGPQQAWKNATEQVKNVENDGALDHSEPQQSWKNATEQLKNDEIDGALDHFEPQQASENTTGQIKNVEMMEFV